ncbi:MAG: choice-of-anchor D domain-containing protein [Blastocatellia bacterium]
MQPGYEKSQVIHSGSGALIAPAEVEVDETKALIDNLFREGKYEEAGPHLETMLKAAEGAKDLGKKAWSLHQMGVRAFAMGDLVGARAYWNNSLKIRKSLKDHGGVAATNYHLQMIRPSLSFFERMADRIREIGARVLIPLGAIFALLIFASVKLVPSRPPVPDVAPTPSPTATPNEMDVVITLPTSLPETTPTAAPVAATSPLAPPSAPTQPATAPSPVTSSTASATSPTPAVAPTVRPAAAPAPVITISPRRVHFAGPGEQVITLSNSGSVPVNDLKVNWENNPGVFSASLDCANLDVGKQCRLRIRYSGSTAPSNAALNISYAGGEITMPMGPGSHGMARTPDRLAFADQVVGSGCEIQAVTITNRSTEELEVREISVPGRMFGRKPHFTASQDCERKIAPGNSCAINVSFTPIEDGIHKTELRIKVRQASGGETLPLPSVALIGKGVKPDGVRK